MKELLDKTTKTLLEMDVEDLKREIADLKKEVQNLWEVIRTLSAKSTRAQYIRRKQLEKN